MVVVDRFLYTETQRLTLSDHLENCPYVETVQVRLIHTSNLLDTSEAEVDPLTNCLYTVIDLEVPKLSFSTSYYWNAVSEQILINLSRTLKDQSLYKYH